MKQEILFDGNKIDKIGFGTWRIGGRTSSNPIENNKSLKALRSALELGYTHFDTAEMYASGNAEELIGKAINETGVSRDSLFITSKVMPSNLAYSRLKNSLDRSLQRLKTDYLDLYLIHWPSSNMHLEETFQAMNEAVEQGKIHYLGVSNFNIELMERSRALSDTPIITNQVPYSVTNRRYIENGVLKYCQENDILLTAYSPVEEGHLQIDSTLRDIANQHNATPYQIALAWLVQQPKVITIPMSFKPTHQAENLQAAEIELSPAELARLNTPDY